jgi:tetratricopeptide (TPR) repeat protein
LSRETDPSTRTSEASPASDTAARHTNRGEGGSDAQSAAPAVTRGDAEPPKPPASRPRAHRWRLGSRALQGLWQLITASPAVAVAVLILLTYAWVNRGTVHVLSLDGKQDAELPLRLAQKLDEVAAGAQTGTNPDCTLRQARAIAMPGVTIPGTNVPVDVLLGLFQWGPLAETEIRASLAPTGQEGADRRYRMLIRVEGPDVPARTIVTDPAATETEALTAGAEALYEVLKPTAAAYYYFTRDPDRGMWLVDQVLRTSRTDTTARVLAYHVWGLILRNRGDHVGALARIDAAIALEENRRFFRDRRRLARLRVDAGYIHLDDGDFPPALLAFDGAAADDPEWARPLRLAGDTLRMMGRFHEARRRYRKAMARDRDDAEPWRGMGELRREQGDPSGAVAAMLRARRLERSEDQRAELSLELADLFDAFGCTGSAARERDRAMLVRPDTPRSHWQARRACLAPQCPSPANGTCPTRFACEP